MEIHIKYTSFEPDQETKIYIQKRLNFLDKLAISVKPGTTKLGEAIHAWVEVGKTTRHHQEGKIWYAECELKMPGRNSVRSTSTNYYLGIALEEVKDDLTRLLREEKDRQETKTRRKKKII